MLIKKTMGVMPQLDPVQSLTDMAAQHPGNAKHAHHALLKAVTLLSLQRIQL
jgi:hypothetical protein